MYEEYMYEEYMYDSTGLERVFDWLYQRMTEKCIMKPLELRNERKICCITRFKTDEGGTQCSVIGVTEKMMTCGARRLYIVSTQDIDSNQLSS